MREEPSEPEAAVAIVQARWPEESILLIRRATNPLDPWSGHWAFPGGRRDAEDRDLLETALRELREECGIQLERAQMGKALDHAWAGRRVGRRIQVAPFSFEIDQAIDPIVDQREAAEAIWAPVSLLKDLTLHARMAVPGLPQDVLWPAIRLKDIPLWGFTYRLVCQWVGVEFPGDA